MHACFFASPRTPICACVISEKTSESLNARCTASSSRWPTPATSRANATGDAPDTRSEPICLCPTQPIASRASAIFLSSWALTLGGLVQPHDVGRPKDAKSLTIGRVRRAWAPRRSDSTGVEPGCRVKSDREPIEVAVLPRETRQLTSGGGLLCGDRRVLHSDDSPAASHSLDNRGDDPQAGWELMTLPIDGAAELDD